MLFPPKLGGGEIDIPPPPISEAWGGSFPPRSQRLGGGQFPPSLLTWVFKFPIWPKIYPPNAWGGTDFGIYPPKWRRSPPKSWGGTKNFGGEQLLKKVVPPQNLRPWGGSSLFPPRIQDLGGAVPISFPPHDLGGKKHLWFDP